jgi:hypothetical protein
MSVNLKSLEYNRDIKNKPVFRGGALGGKSIIEDGLTSYLGYIEIFSYRKRLGRGA